MQGYFTIHEFGKLRNININSLRYYEKLGLLIPDYVDPRTGYRYYTARQLVELDIIHLCITLGIPLKQLQQYVTETGSIEVRRLLEDGRKAAREQIAETRANLRQIEYTLEQMDILKAHQNDSGTYVRSFRTRRLVVSPPFTSLRDRAELEKCAESVHAYAQKNRLFPALPAGVLVQFGAVGEPPQHRMFFEITGKKTKGGQIISLPAGPYRCVQTQLNPIRDVKKFILETFGPLENTLIIVSNIMLEKLSFRERMAEIQRKESEG